MKTRFHDFRDPAHGRRLYAFRPAMPAGRFLENRIMATNITSEHKRAFEALKSGEYENFALFSCHVNDQPAAAIVAVTVHPPDQEGGEPEYGIHPLFVSVTPSMRLTDHDGRDV